MQNKITNSRQQDGPCSTLVMCKYELKSESHFSAGFTMRRWCYHVEEQSSRHREVLTVNGWVGNPYSLSKLIEVALKNEPYRKPYTHTL